MVDFLMYLYNGLMICIPLFLVLALAQLLFLLFGRREKRRRRIFRLLGLLGVTALIPLALLGLYRGVIAPSMARELLKARDQRVANVSLVEAGDAAPLFVVQDIKGMPFDLEKLRGKIVVLNFFATWCGPCQVELPWLNRLCIDMREEADVVFIAIGREESDKELIDFQRKNNFSFRIAADPDRAIFDKYAKELIPRTYLIDPQGRIRLATTGANEEDFNRLTRELRRSKE